MEEPEGAVAPELEEPEHGAEPEEEPEAPGDAPMGEEPDEVIEPEEPPRTAEGAPDEAPVEEPQPTNQGTEGDAE